MAEENIPSGETQSTEVQNEEFVSKKAYEEVTKDMHKYKSKTKELSAAKAEYEAKLKAIEEEKLAEQDRWKELYEKTKQEAEEFRSNAENMKKQTEMSVKRQALKDELGKIKDVYLSHANIEAIELNEHGMVDKDSLIAVANQFREEHGELILPASGGKATSSAPGSIQVKEQSLSDMSLDEKLKYLKSMKTS